MSGTMQAIPIVKSRKEKRKEARRAKTQQRLHQWVIHQAGKRRRAKKEAENQQPASEDPSSLVKVKDGHESRQEKPKLVTPEAPAVEHKGARSRTPHRDEKKAKKGKTKFEEFLERDLERAALISAEADLDLERRLAKKLKVKRGKLGGFDDGLTDILDGLGEGAEILESKEAVSRIRGSQRKKSAPDAEALSLKQQKQVESEDDLIGDDHEDSDGSLQDMLIDDEDGSSLSGADSDDAEDEQSGSEVEDHEESGLELQTNGSEDGSDSEQVDGSVSGSDEEGEDEVGEEDETEYSNDDAKDVNLPDGAKPRGEKLTERSNRKDEDTDIYGRKKVDAAVKYVPPHLRGKTNDLSEETIRIQRRLRGMISIFSLH